MESLDEIREIEEEAIRLLDSPQRSETANIYTSARVDGLIWALSKLRKETEEQVRFKLHWSRSE